MLKIDIEDVRVENYHKFIDEFYTNEKPSNLYTVFEPSDKYVKVIRFVTGKESNAIIIGKNKVYLCNDEGKTIQVVEAGKLP